MAIEKNNYKVSRIDTEFSSRSRETMSSDEDELQRRSSALESDDDDDFDDADSGAGSDDFDLLELGETGAEFCQIGNQTCSIPLELYDLPGLEGILSIDVWNEVLSEEERYVLAKYLPDMDHETFVLTMKELLTGSNFHFESPMKKLFDLLKGGLCEPRVALYREGLSFFQKRQHYHLLRKYQNDMVNNLCQIRDAWLNCRGYSIEEKLRVLNIMRSQKSLMFEKMDNLGSDSSEKNSGDVLYSRKSNDKKAAQRMLHRSAHGQEYEFYPVEQSAVMDPAKYGKQNPKGILKSAGSKPHLGKDVTSRFPSSHNSGVPFPQPNKAGVYDTGVLLRSRDQNKMGEFAEERTNDMEFRRDLDVSPGNPIETSESFRMGKRRAHLRIDKIAPDSFLGVPLMSKTDLQPYARDSDQLEDVKMVKSKPSAKASCDFARGAEYPENVQQYVIGEKFKSVKSRGPHLPTRGSMIDSSSRAELFWHTKLQGDDFSRDSTFQSDKLTLKSKKQKGRESPDLGYKNYRSSSTQVTERYLHPDFRSKSSQESGRGAFIHNGGDDVVTQKGNRVIHRSRDTESDSSDNFDDGEYSNPFLRSKSAYPHRTRDSVSRSHPDPKKVQSVKRKMKDYDSLDGIGDAKKIGGFEERDRLPGFENYLTNAKQKGKVQIDSTSRNSAHVPEDAYVSDKLDDSDDAKPIVKFSKHMRTQGESIEMLYTSSSMSYTNDGKRKNRTGSDYSNPKSHYLNNNDCEKEDDLLAPRSVVEGIGMVQSRFGKKGKKFGSSMNDPSERSEASLLGCHSISKRRKEKEDVMHIDAREENANLQPNFSMEFDDSSSLKRKAKKKSEPDTVSLENEESALPNSGIRTTDMDMDMDMDMDIEPQKKSFTLITPTVHTGFSFSIIHLLSAVRLAMIMPHPVDHSNIGIPKDDLGKEHGGGVNGLHDDEKGDSIDGHTLQGDIPFLSIQEIVYRVRLNPGDPCILETQEPLQDLIRGVMKIFSSKSAPLGAKGWKVLAIYEKTTKSWSWVGPVVHKYSDHATEEVTTPESWGIPHKMLVKLVDTFANWLKSGQDTLKQIGSLPAPPLALMQVNLDEKERFKDLRAQKSLNTISPSSEEVRDYFRKEEFLRYSIPDRAFSYTAADGKKSIVAPLRRCGGKPTSKARDHFMLKRDRPPHVTVLCLVRDAAARLPGSIGTRADVCTLIRDSQYIVEDVSDAQVNQVVSGALDRLHYERDPCVQYDSERKLWVYLHRDREEEDFEDDGTSSTKKWKRPKREVGDHPDQEAVTVAYHGAREQSCRDVCSDLNVEPSSVELDNNDVEAVTNNVRLNMEDSIDDGHESEDAGVQEGSTVLDSLAVKTVPKDKFLYQENSTNEELEDE